MDYQREQDLKDRFKHVDYIVLTIVQNGEFVGEVECWDLYDAIDTIHLFEIENEVFF